MNLERRLQHAARELREVNVDVPTLGGPPVSRRRPFGVLQAAAVPMLFVAGGLFAVSGVRGATPEPVPHDSDIVVPVLQPEGSDEPAEPSLVDVPAVTSDESVGDGAAHTAPSVHVELQMIADNRAPVDPAQPSNTSELPSAAQQRAANLGPI